MPLRIRYKIVLPFVVLLAFTGSVGTMIVTARVTDATTGEFDGSLLRASLLANDHLGLLEAQRLAQLRAASDTVGVAEGVAAGDVDGLIRLLVPIQANARPASLTIRVLNSKGLELLQLPGPGAAATRRSLDATYAAESSVQDILAGRRDSRGDKFVFLARDTAGPVLYWVGPVRNDRGEVAGAMLLGEPLSDVTDRIRSSHASELTFYDRTGLPLSTSLKGVPALGDPIRATVTGDHPVRALQAIDGHGYGLLVSDWTMRGAQLGYVAVALDAEPLRAGVAQVRFTLTLLFILAALLTMLAGVALAARITHPLEQLVHAMQAVTAGDLSQRAPQGPHDEIGFLAGAFNEMTASLQDNRRALEQTYFASMEALARAIDARDPYTLGHSSRVAAISLELAAAMNFPEEERETLRRSALLHDVGKIGVEDRILHKAGPLEEGEFEALRRHPVIGYDMLAGLRFLRDSMPGVRHHHERWDGTGYPDGLQGEAIPPAVRILSVADVLDAITSDRPYARGLGLEQAVTYIVKNSGTQFDPAVVAALRSRIDPIGALLKRMGKAPAPHPADVGWLEAVG